MHQTYKLDLLIGLYILAIALTELLGAKTTPLFSIGSVHLTASVALIFFPFIFTANDMIIEVFGVQRARNVVRIGLVSVALIFVIAAIATYLPPSARFAPNEAAYDTVFGGAIRISLASLIAFASAEFLDVALFERLRRKLHGKALWLRNNLSNAVAQLADTTIFLTLAFWSTQHSVEGNLTFLVGLILPYWLLKCFASALGTPLVYLGVRWLREDGQTFGTTSEVNRAMTPAR